MRHSLEAKDEKIYNMLIAIAVTVGRQIPSYTKSDESYIVVIVVGMVVVVLIVNYCIELM
jgi:hypothetical protein